MKEQLSSLTKGKRSSKTANSLKTRGIALTGLFLMSWLATLSVAAAQSRSTQQFLAFLPLLQKNPSAPSKILITEVMYDVADEPEEEWVEIYNAGSSAVDLSDYKIGDEETQGGGEGMVQFPPGTIIEPGQVMVIANTATAFRNVFGFDPDFEVQSSDDAVPDMIDDPLWSSGNPLLSNTGDEVILLNGRDEIIDALSWGSSTWAFDPSAPDVSEGHSLERYPVSVDTDSAADWRDQNVPAPGEVDLTLPTPTPVPTPTPTPTPLPPLLINEILADPAGDLSGDANRDGVRDGSDDEFVEILNTADYPIDISGWTLSDGVRIRHVFLNGTVIPPGCGIVVFGGGNPRGEFGGCGVQIATSGALGLNNSGDTVTLLDLRSRVIDAVTYNAEGGKDQSLTRAPDISGGFVLHSEANGSNGALFSPGYHIDGALFEGCTP